MAHKKQGGKLVQSTRPLPKYLGVKVTDGQEIKAGSILVRQRGTKFSAGTNVKVGRDHTLYSKIQGKVKFGKSNGKNIISVV